MPILPRYPGDRGDRSHVDNPPPSDAGRLDLGRPPLYRIQPNFTKPASSGDHQQTHLRAVPQSMTQNLAFTNNTSQHGAVGRQYNQAQQNVDVSLQSHVNLGQQQQHMTPQGGSLDDSQLQAEANFDHYDANGILPDGMLVSSNLSLMNSGEHTQYSPPLSAFFGVTDPDYVPNGEITVAAYRQAQGVLAGQGSPTDEQPAMVNVNDLTVDSGNDLLRDRTHRSQLPAAEDSILPQQYPLKPTLTQYANLKHHQQVVEYQNQLATRFQYRVTPNASEPGAPGVRHRATVDQYPQTAEQNNTDFEAQQHVGRSKQNDLLDSNTPNPQLNNTDGGSGGLSYAAKKGPVLGPPPHPYRQMYGGIMAPPKSGRQLNSKTGLFFSSYSEAEAGIQPPNWKFKDQGNANIPKTDEQKQDYVRRLVGAFMDMQNVGDKDDGKGFVNRWATRKNPDGNSDLSFHGADVVEKACWYMLELLCQLYTTGLQGLPVHDEKLLAFAENEKNHTFEERFNALADLLATYKARCDKAIKWGDILSMVLAPVHAGKSGAQNRGANDRRQKIIIGGRQAMNTFANEEGEDVDDAEDAENGEPTETKRRPRQSRKPRQSSKNGNAVQIDDSQPTVMPPAVDTRQAAPAPSSQIVDSTPQVTAAMNNAQQLPQPDSSVGNSTNSPGMYGHQKDAPHTSLDALRQLAQPARNEFFLMGNSSQQLPGISIYPPSVHNSNPASHTANGQRHPHAEEAPRGRNVQIPRTEVVSMPKFGGIEQNSTESKPGVHGHNSVHNVAQQPDINCLMPGPIEVNSEQPNHGHHPIGTPTSDSEKQLQEKDETFSASNGAVQLLQEADTDMPPTAACQYRRVDETSSRHQNHIPHAEFRVEEWMDENGNIRGDELGPEYFGPSPPAGPVNEAQLTEASIDPCLLDISDVSHGAAETSHRDESWDDSGSSRDGNFEYDDEPPTGSAMKYHATAIDDESHHYHTQEVSHSSQVQNNGQVPINGHLPTATQVESGDQVQTHGEISVNGIQQHGYHAQPQGYQYGHQGATPFILPDDYAQAQPYSPYDPPPQNYGTGQLRRAAYVVTQQNGVRQNSAHSVNGQHVQNPQASVPSSLHRKRRRDPDDEGERNAPHPKNPKLDG